MSGLREKSNMNHLTKRLGYLKLIYFTCVCGFLLWSLECAPRAERQRPADTTRCGHGCGPLPGPDAGERAACGCGVSRARARPDRTPHMDMDMRTSMCEMWFLILLYRTNLRPSPKCF